jgi:hypothetical protein
MTDNLILLTIGIWMLCASMLIVALVDWITRKLFNWSPREQIGKLLDDRRID